MAVSVHPPYDWRNARRSSMRRSFLRFALPAAGSAIAVCASMLAGDSTPAQADQLFQALELNQDAFIVVAAPIGTSGQKAQLQIYEQVNAKKRPCFQTDNGTPARVNPLLGTFDFTGICSRYIDSVGYSTRVGGEDLFKTYRLVVRKSADDNLLFATAGPGKPELLVARTYGTAGPVDFLQFKFEPGWRLMRRAYGGRALGHVYLYRDSWPSEAVAATASPAATPPGTTPAATTPPAQAVPAPAAAVPATPPAKTAPAATGATSAVKSSQAAVVPSSAPPPPPALRSQTALPGAQVAQPSPKPASVKPPSAGGA